MQSSPRVADPEDKQSTLCPTHQSCLQHSRDDAMQAVKVYCPHDNLSQHSRGDCIQAVKAGETGDEDIIRLAVMQAVKSISFPSKSPSAQS